MWGLENGLRADSLEGLGSLVLQAVELPLPAFDDAHPGPREKLRSPGVILSNLEADLRRVPGDRRLWILGEIHVRVRVEILLLCPLLGRAHLVLQAFREVSPRSVGPLVRLLYVHVEDRLLGLVRRRNWFTGRLFDSHVRCVRVTGPLDGGRIQDSQLRFDEAREGPGCLLPGLRAEQRPRTRADDEKQEKRDHR